MFYGQEVTIEIIYENTVAFNSIHFELGKVKIFKNRIRKIKCIPMIQHIKTINSLSFVIFFSEDVQILSYDMKTSFVFEILFQTKKSIQLEDTTRYNV